MYSGKIVREMGPSETLGTTGHAPFDVTSTPLHTTHPGVQLDVLCTQDNAGNVLNHVSPIMLLSSLLLFVINKDF